MTRAIGIEGGWPIDAPVRINPHQGNGHGAGPAPGNGRWEPTMDEAKLRQAVCDAGQQLWQRRLIHGQGGLVCAELNRRGFIVTPPGRRRAALRPDQLMCVDLTGVDMLSSDRPLPEDLWRPHRVALQNAAFLESHGRAVHATALATPPNVMAMLTLAPDAATLAVLNFGELPILDPADEKAIGQALAKGPLVVLRGVGVMAADVTIDACLDALEAVEHHAAIDLTTAGLRD